MLRSPRVEVAVHKSRASVTAFPWHPHAANFEQREGVVLRSASLQVPDSSAHPLIILNLPHNLTDKLPRGPTPPSMEERNSGSKTLEDVERLMGVIRQEVQAGTWADDATTKRPRRNNKSAKNSTAASSSANLAEDTEQEEDEEEELETDEEEDEKSAGRSSPVQDVPLLGRSHAEKLSKSKQPTSTENLNADEEPEDDDEKITMKEEPTPGPSLLESTVAPPVVPLDVPASIMSAVTLFMSAAQKTDFEQHVIAMEDKLEYNNLAPVLGNAHLLRFLLALFTYHARIFDPRTPEGYGCRIDYILVDRVRHYMEEVGTGDLGALVEVVIAEGEYERPALRRRLDRLMKKR
jgi:hypothetical protein